eukprot:3602409-Prymnesium_polylepis.2
MHTSALGIPFERIHVVEQPVGIGVFLDTFMQIPRVLHVIPIHLCSICKQLRFGHLTLLGCPNAQIAVDVSHEELIELRDICANAEGRRADEKKRVSGASGGGGMAATASDNRWHTC